MIAILFVVLLVIPIAELIVITRVAGLLGWLPTLVLLIAISAAGAALLKREGLAAWRRVQAAVARGEVPAKEVADGALILFGGALLLTPGFLTDAVGLLLMLPPVRVAVRGIVRRAAAWLALRRFGVAGEVSKRVYDARVVRARRGSTAVRPPLSPPGGVPQDEDGSPDKG